MPHAIRRGDIPGVQLRYERTYPLTAEELWVWLTEPSLQRLWLADSVETTEDGEQRWVLGREDEAEGSYAERVRTLSVDEPSTWIAAFEWLDQDWKSATRLAFSISPTDPAELSVVQDGFHRLSLSECLTVWEHYRRRWRTAFDRLAEAVERAQFADD